VERLFARKNSGNTDAYTEPCPHHAGDGVRSLTGIAAQLAARKARTVRDHELPIRMPVRNTSTPPTTTWNNAATSGVSM